MKPFRSSLFVPLPEIEEMGRQDPSDDAKHGHDTGKAKSSERPKLIVLSPEKEKAAADKTLQWIDPVLG